jgi:hypothetical protein
MIRTGRVAAARHHLDTLRSADNLAEDLRALGDLAGARTLHEDALPITRGCGGLEAG